jgi:AraC family transcriptional regulator
VGVVRPQRQLLIDFASPPAPRQVAFKDRLGFGSVTLAACTLQPTDGLQIGSFQVGVVLHQGARFPLDWRLPGGDRLHSARIAHGRAHIVDARLPFWIRTAASPSFLAMAVDKTFLTRIWQTGFEGLGDTSVRTSIDIDDPVLRRLGQLANAELRQGGPGGQLYAESLGTALAVHLLRQYGTLGRTPARRNGGLTPAQLRRVAEYIEAHLTEELGLTELAAVASLSPHHFGAAFKAATGTPPHRFVVERRVQRARTLLAGRDTIAGIAHAVGFAGQSHLTLHFRRVTGVTPARFRRLLA